MPTPAAPTIPPEASGRLPRQIPYIIHNEGCERIDLYGMRNIIVPFLPALAFGRHARRYPMHDYYRSTSNGVAA